MADRYGATHSKRDGHLCLRVTHLKSFFHSGFATKYEIYPSRYRVDRPTASNLLIRSMRTTDQSVSVAHSLVLGVQHLLLRFAEQNDSKRREYKVLGKSWVRHTLLHTAQALIWGPMEHFGTWTPEE